MEPTELRQLLQERAAAAHFAPVDAERILGAARSRRLRQHRGGAALLAAATAAAVFAALATGGSPGAGKPDQLLPLATSTSIAPPPSPSAAPLPELPTTTPAPLTAGWIAAPAGPLTQQDAVDVPVGTRIVYWGGQVGPDGKTLIGNRGAVFDVPARKWSLMAAAPLSGRFAVAAAGSDRYFFAWGGRSLVKYFSDGALFDTWTNTWSTIPAGPLNGQENIGAVWTGTEFVVITAAPGGKQQTVSLCAAYNPVTKRWRMLPNLPTNPASPAALMVGGQIVVVGANAGYALAPDAATWRDIPAPPENMEDATLRFAAQGNYIYAVARVAVRKVAAPVPLMFERFTFSAGVWDERPSPPLEEVECYPKLAMSTTEVFLGYCSGNAAFNRQGQYWTAASDAGVGQPVGVGSELVFYSPGATRTVIYTGP
jgi:hypothetical protein